MAAPNEIDVVRAWKDEEYRDSLPADVREALPDAPANLNELSSEELAQAAGSGTDWGVVVDNLQEIPNSVQSAYNAWTTDE